MKVLATSYAGATSCRVYNQCLGECISYKGPSDPANPAARVDLAERPGQKGLGSQETPSLSQVAQKGLRAPFRALSWHGLGGWRKQCLGR